MDLTKQDKIDQLTLAKVDGVEPDPEKTTHAALDDLAKDAGVVFGTQETTESSSSTLPPPPPSGPPAEDAGLSGAIATREENAELEHSDSGRTTRDDTLDAGVPMLQGDPSEPQGPEDAFGDGPKRGDYSQRVERGPHATSVPNPKAGQPIQEWVKDGQVVTEGTKGAELQTVDYEPNAILVDQAANASDVGEVPGLKGGVAT